jgi:hypothetical protein
MQSFKYVAYGSGNEAYTSMTYSLRPELLVAGMDVSRCILVLDTSISATSNLGRREYYVAYHLRPRTWEIMKEKKTCLFVGWMARESWNKWISFTLTLQRLARLRRWMTSCIHACTHGTVAPAMDGLVFSLFFSRLLFRSIFLSSMRFEPNKLNYSKASFLFLYYYYYHYYLQKKNSPSCYCIFVVSEKETKAAPRILRPPAYTYLRNVHVRS